MRLTTRKYYFNVEGCTERLYLEWLQTIINSNQERTFNVSFDIKIGIDPCTMVKKIVNISKLKIYQLVDVESNKIEDIKRFRGVIDKMKIAKGLGKQIEFDLGYSNYTFDLWIVLHKIDARSSLSKKSQYLQLINRGYGVNFDKMEDYKKADNFKKCLSMLNLNNVVDAVNRSRDIMLINEKDHIKEFEDYKKIKYCKANPALNIGEIVGKILKEVGLIREKNSIK